MGELRWPKLGLGLHPQWEEYWQVPLKDSLLPFTIQPWGRTCSIVHSQNLWWNSEVQKDPFVTIWTECAPYPRALCNDGVCGWCSGYLKKTGQSRKYSLKTGSWKTNVPFCTSHASFKHLPRVTEYTSLPSVIFTYHVLFAHLNHTRSSSVLKLSSWGKRRQLCSKQSQEAPFFLFAGSHPHYKKKLISSARKALVCQEPQGTDEVLMCRGFESLFSASAIFFLSCEKSNPGDEPKRGLGWVNTDCVWIAW